jgi:hypothetical protein
MGRSLLIAEYYIQTKNEENQKLLYPVYIATSHFESLDVSTFVENRRS